MIRTRAQRWGFLLLFTGFALAISGIWMLLAPDRYEATIRIKFNSSPTGPNGDQSYDPYFIQTEFEIIKSDIILGKVVDSLHLDIEWGKRYANGKTLSQTEAISLLKQHLRLQPVKNTMLLDIGVISEDAAEAAKIANAIVETYGKKRQEDLQMLQNRGLLVLKEDLQDQQRKIDDLQSNVVYLTEELNSSTSQSTQQKIQDYSDATNKLEKMKHFMSILKLKVESMAGRSDYSGSPAVSVIKSAQPPTSPLHANRRTAKILLSTGLFLILVGTRLLYRVNFAAPRGDSMMNS